MATLPMLNAARRRVRPALLCAALVVALPVSSLAQTAPATRATPVAQPSNLVDANDTREQFMEILRLHPPSLGRVLRLDPALLNNDAYIAPYPSLVAFLAQHPEVRRNPEYFLAPINVGYPYSNYNSGSRDIWEGMMVGVAIMFGLITVLSTLAWVIRTIVDYRRWHRLSKTQAEAHTKLLDRFTANEELLAYVQSPAGSRFLQSAPIALDPGAKTPGAPLARILWSVQAGMVAVAGGLGLCYVSGRVDVDKDVVQPLYTMGVFAVSLGLGFILSAIVSFVLSRRLGLFDTPQTPPLADGRDRRDASGV